DYYDNQFGNAYSDLGKKERLQYVLFQQIRVSLAAEVQSLLQKKDAVTAADVDAILTKMQGMLNTDAGVEQRFNSVLADAKRMDMDDYNQTANPLKLL